MSINPIRPLQSIIESKIKGGNNALKKTVELVKFVFKNYLKAEIKLHYAERTYNDLLGYKNNIISKLKERAVKYKKVKREIKQREKQIQEETEILGKVSSYLEKIDKMRALKAGIEQLKAEVIKEENKKDPTLKNKPLLDASLETAKRIHEKEEVIRDIEFELEKEKAKALEIFPEKYHEMILFKPEELPRELMQSIKNLNIIRREIHKKESGLKSDIEKLAKQREQVVKKVKEAKKALEKESKEFLVIKANAKEKIEALYLSVMGSRNKMNFECLGFEIRDVKMGDEEVIPVSSSDTKNKRAICAKAVSSKTNTIALQGASEKPLRYVSFDDILKAKTGQEKGLLMRIKEMLHNLWIRIIALLNMLRQRIA